MKAFSAWFVILFLYNVGIDCMVKNPKSSVDSEAQVSEEMASTDIHGERLSHEDFHQADFVNESLDSFPVDPIEFAGLFEGDIDLGPMQKGDSRNAIRDKGMKWADKTIPYTIDREYSSGQRSVIKGAMKVYHEKTCIKFRPRNSERDYIHIKKGRGCSSNVGRQGGKQTVSLADPCVHTGKATFT